ncbi:MAG TPA: ATP-binding cassette domain-containing protein [Propionicimonas sp.]|nr:ATP-binding cassette domain-containing protein [Propionicimonas sp.]
MGSGLELVDVGVAYGSTRVVESVSLQVAPGRIVGLVGESGSGKTTLARAIIGSVPLASGSIRLDGVELRSGHRSRAERRAIQLVQQDPFASLNPALTIGFVLDELLRVHGLGGDRAGRRARSSELLGLVGLEAEALDRYPRQFSGGQRQRMAIARALAVEPAVLVADEPTSSLDVSVQKTVLELLSGLAAQMNLATLFISHDLSVINAVCDHVAVLQGGRLVEVAPSGRFFTHPEHPYSRALLEAVPRIGEEAR